MNHKYSTWILLGLMVLGVVTLFVEGIDGLGSKYSLARFENPDLLVNSSIVDDGGSVNVSVPLYVQGVLITGSPIAPGGNDTLTYKNECFASCDTLLFVAENG
jgi:hypothetical protein